MNEEENIIISENRNTYDQDNPKKKGGSIVLIIVGILLLIAAIYGAVMVGSLHQTLLQSAGSEDSSEVFGNVVGLILLLPTIIVGLVIIGIVAIVFTALSLSKFIKIKRTYNEIHKLTLANLIIYSLNTVLCIYMAITLVVIFTIANKDSSSTETSFLLLSLLH